jgi:AcrR family transcriptional regulator
LLLPLPSSDRGRAAYPERATQGVSLNTALQTHVAPQSGASVYQYFPNKAAILFRLQSDEWRQTSELLRGILEDVRRPPLERVRTLVHAFIRSECGEAAVRVALDDAAPLYRDAPEAREAMASGERIVQVFMREALPRASAATRALAADLITTTFSAVGKQFSETRRTPAEIKAYADAMADMFCAYLRGLSLTPAPRPRQRKRHRYRASARRGAAVSPLDLGSAGDSV